MPLALAGEGEELFDELGGPGDGAAGFGEVVAELFGGGAHLREFDVRGDDGEEVVEVVGDAAGHQAEAFEFQGLHAGFFEPLTRGDVADGHGRADDFAADANDGRERAFDPAGGEARDAELAFDGERLPGEGVLDFAEEGAAFAEERVVEEVGAFDDGGAGDALEEAAGAGVDPAYGQVRADDHHGIARAAEDGLGFGARFGQCLLGELFAGDIHVDPDHAERRAIGGAFGDPPAGADPAPLAGRGVEAPLRLVHLGFAVQVGTPGAGDGLLVAAVHMLEEVERLDGALVVVA